MERPVGTPVDAKPEGTLITGQRLTMLKQTVISQCRILGCSTPLIVSFGSMRLAPAFTEGTGNVGQINTRYRRCTLPSLLNIRPSISSASRNDGAAKRLQPATNSLA